MPVFPHQNINPVDEETPPNDEETCFPELIDPFSPSLTVQIKNYQRQRQKKILSVGDIPVNESHFIQEGPPQREADLEAALPSNRQSWGSCEGDAGIHHQSCGEAPVVTARGRRPERNQFLHPPGGYNRASWLRGDEAQHDTTVNQGGYLAGQSGNVLSASENAYASSSTSASPHSTPANSRSPSAVRQPFPFTVPGGVPSRSFLPQQKEAPQFFFTSTTIPKEEPLKIRIYVLFARVIFPQIYLHCLLRVPYLYLSRVHEIFQDSTITLKDFEKLTLMDGAEPGENGSMSDFSDSSKQSYARMKANWEMFIDGLMREWKTFNIISGLLLSGILSIFQAEGANSEPITRYAALCSLVCALISLIYGCFFIIRFGSMRRVSRGVEWAFASCSDQSLIWNVYVLLAMPIIWLIWSIIAFLISIMAFMWRVRPGHDIPDVSPNLDLTFRLFVCLVLGLGMAYAVLIISTLRHYGAEMDKAWNSRMREFWDRRTYGKGSQRERQPKTTSNSKPYVFCPSPSPMPPQTQVHAFERLSVPPASVSPQPPAPTSPTLVSTSPAPPQLSPENSYLPMKISSPHHRPQSSVDISTPIVIPPTPTQLQSSANSYIDTSSHYTTSPVNESQSPEAIPPPLESLPSSPGKTNERIPPSFSRRHEAIASSSSHDTWTGSTPITDPPITRNEAHFRAPPAAVIATDPPPAPDIQVVPLVKSKLESQMNNVETSGERSFQSGGNSNSETHVADHIPLSQSPNANRSNSEINLEFRQEEYRMDADTDGTRKTNRNWKDRLLWSMAKRLNFSSAN